VAARYHMLRFISYSGALTYVEGNCSNTPKGFRAATNSRLQLLDPEHKAHIEAIFLLIIETY